MWKFLINQILILSALIKNLNGVIEAFLSSDLKYENKLNEFIQLFLEWTDQHQKEEIRNQILTHVNEYELAKRGINSVTFSKLTLGKIELRKMYFQRITSIFSISLIEEKQKLEKKVEEAKLDIHQLILASIQSGILDKNQLMNYTDEAIDLYWKTLNGSNEVAAVKARIALKVGKADILIIIKECFESISSA